MLFFLGNQAVFSQSTQWAKRFGGNTSDVGASVTTDDSSNIYVAGNFTGTVDFDPGPGTFNLVSAGADDVYICKLDSSGNFLWVRQFGGSSSESVNAIAIDHSGNILTTGKFHANADFDPGPGVFNIPYSPGINGFISKLNSAGDFVWAKGIGTFGSKSVAVDNSDNVIVAGYFIGSYDFDPGPSIYNLSSNGLGDIFICKLDPQGNFMWAKSAGSAENDFAYAMTVDNAGNIYTTGFFNGSVDFDPGPGTQYLTTIGPNDLEDVFILKLDSMGNYVWAKQVGGWLEDDAYGIAVDGSCNVLVTGTFSHIADFDPGVGIFYLSDPNDGNIFVLKLDSAGAFLWARQMGGPGSGGEGGYSIDVDAFNNVYTTGNFSSDGDFDPGQGTYILQAAGNYNIFISKLNSSGDFVWAKKLAGPDDSRGISIVIDISNNVCVTGYFNGIADFNPDVPITTLTSAGQSDAFVYKFYSCVNLNFTKSNVSCNGKSDGNIDLNITGGATPYSFLWNTGDATEDLVGIVAGNYTVSVTTSSACTSTFSITITEPPVLTLSTLTTPDDGSGNGSAAAIATGGTPLYSYLWNNALTTPNALNLVAGTYSVIVTDMNGCSDTADAVINSTVGIFSPDVQIKQNSISIFPNPNRGKFILNFETTIPLSNQIEIFNNNGQVVYSLEVRNSSEKLSQEIDINFLAKGIYFLQIKNVLGLFNRKIVIQ